MSFYGAYKGMGGGGGGGVTSLDGMTGALTLVAGTGISIVDGIGTITISSTSAGDVTLTAFGSSPNANAATLTGQALTLQPASASFPGGVSTTTQSFAGNKTFTGTIAASNLSGTNTGDVTIGTANGLSIVGQALSLALSSTSTTGALSSTDWNTFNGKQAAGNYITALTGDATATGPGSVALTLATVNGNVGTFGTATQVSTVTVNAKGLVTAASNTSIQIAESQVTNLVSDLAGKQPTGNYITALTGDATATGPGSVALTLATVNGNVGTFASVTVNAKGLVTAATALSGDATTSGAALTLATVNSNVGTFGTATQTSTFTVNAKGLITAASNTSIQITESQVTNLTTDLAAKMTNPMTTGGDVIYGGASGTPTRLANGTAGQVLQSAGTTAAPTWSSSIGPTTGMAIVGTNTNNNAAAGIVGEFVSANSAGVGVATSGNYVNISSISLTAGDWDVEGFGVLNIGSGTGFTGYLSAISTSTAALDSATNGGYGQLNLASIPGQTAIPSGSRRILLSATTTIYHVGLASYSSAGTASWTSSSFLRARRVR